MSVLFAVLLMVGSAPSDRLVSELEEMWLDYRELMAACQGNVDLGMLPEHDPFRVPNFPDAQACDEAEELEATYRERVKELLRIDRRRVLFDDIPRDVDREWKKR